MEVALGPYPFRDPTFGPIVRDLFRMTQILETKLLEWAGDDPTSMAVILCKRREGVVNEKSPQEPLSEEEILAVLKGTSWME